MSERHPHPRCPTCRKPLPESRGKERPFCSERCKLVDLQKWLGGAFAIPAADHGDERGDDTD